MWDLSFPARDRTYNPCSRRWRLNHWITKEVPHIYFGMKHVCVPSTLFNPLGPILWKPSENPALSQSVAEEALTVIKAEWDREAHDKVRRARAGPSTKAESFPFRMSPKSIPKGVFSLWALLLLFLTDRITFYGRLCSGLHSTPCDTFLIFFFFFFRIISLWPLGHYTLCINYTAYGASQVVLVVKNLPADAEDTRDAVSIPGSRRFPGEGRGNPLQSSCLNRGAWWATVHRTAKSQKWLKQLSTHTYCSWIFFSWQNLCQSFDLWVTISLEIKQGINKSPNG